MVTFSASGVVNLFVDGGSPVTGSGTAGVTSTNPFTIGHHAWIASGQGPDPLDGYVDELMIYDRELSSQEVQMIYQQYP